MHGSRPPPQSIGMRMGGGGGAPPPHSSGPVTSARDAREQGQRIAAEQTQRMIMQAEQARQQQLQQQGTRIQPPMNGPMSFGSDRASINPSFLGGGPPPPPGANYPPSIASRDTQYSSQRDHAFQHLQQRQRGPDQAASPQHRGPYGADIAYSSMPPSNVQAPQQPYSRPPPGRQSVVSPFIPGSNPYPVYPAQLSSADPVHLPAPEPAGTPPPNASNEKKKQSLWSQIKQM